MVTAARMEQKPKINLYEESSPYELLSVVNEVSLMADIEVILFESCFKSENLINDFVINDFEVLVVDSSPPELIQIFNNINQKPKNNPNYRNARDSLSWC